MQTANKCHVKLNYDKLQYKQNEVEFFGETNTTSGHKPSKDKVSHIISMPSPTNEKQVQSFIGIINYLAKFYLRLSELAEPIRELSKDKVPFNWRPEQQVFVQMKKEVASAPILIHYNPTKQTILQTDASIECLGACLLQDFKPVYFADKTLTSAKKTYVVMELEYLVVVLAMEKFNFFYTPVISYLKLTRNHLKPYYLKV